MKYKKEREYYCNDCFNFIDRKCSERYGKVEVDETDDSVPWNYIWCTKHRSKYLSKLVDKGGILEGGYCKSIPLAVKKHS